MLAFALVLAMPVHEGVGHMVAPFSSAGYSAGACLLAVLPVGSFMGLAYIQGSWAR